MNNLIRRMLMKLVGRAIGDRIREAAEGGRGAGLYNFLRGKKTWTSLILFVTAGVLLGFGQTEYASWATYAAAAILPFGLGDKALHADPLHWLRGQAWYKVLAEWSPVITVVMGTLWGWSIAGHCIGPCEWYGGMGTYQGILLGISYAAGSLGLIDAGWKAARPSSLRLDFTR